MVLWADHSSSVCGGSLFWLYDSKEALLLSVGTEKEQYKTGIALAMPVLCACGGKGKLRRRWNICDRDQRSYSDRSAVTGLHLAALIEGIRPPRMVSSVESSTRITAASSGSTAVI